APRVLAPSAGTFLSAVADDRVPVAIGFGLVVGRDLERECLGLPESGSAVEADARDAANGEVDGQDVTLLSGRKVAGREHDLADMAVGKRLGVEVRRVERVALEPEADRVLRGHVGTPVP